MKINEQLHIVMTVDNDDDGSTVYVHASPISREVAKRYWMPLGKAFALIYGEAMQLVGPRVAADALRKVSEDLGVWGGPIGVERGLMPEIRRLANVIAPGTGAGWQIIPYDDALRMDLISEDDADTIEGNLVFFTLAWRLNLPRERKDLIRSLGTLWDASISSLSLSAFVAGLPTSTGTGNTGETPQVPLSPPSSTGEPMKAFASVLPNAMAMTPSLGIPQ